MLLGVGLLVLLASVPPAGGQLGRLAEVRFRASGLIVAALLAQVVVLEVVPGGPRPLLEGVHIATYVAGAAFVLANVRVPGMALMGAGGALNAIAITANGGVMPAAPGALARAGLAAGGDHFANSTAVAGAHLWWLGDVFATPAGLPFSNVFSVGDVVLLAGAAVALHVVCASRAGRLLPAPRI